jgi:predicted signal transduction protein with EAL and GGDEF domain
MITWQDDMPANQGVSRMHPYIAAIVLFLSSAWAFAQEEEEPFEPNMMGVWIFLFVVVLCAVWGVWWFMRANKKPPEEREGDKF